MAAIAVETGLPPSELMADEWMLHAIIAYLKDRQRKAESASKMRRSRRRR